ncbi:ladderlectin-like [Astatotilapia calliptera]|uniref:C-type lectin domain-containing protein n=1 Tax=Astatotilapia calliptera TaxID=8154 RepID=A0AAX7VNY0_ASTCA|nr:ladderlectin-like [Astatotilapia calliptera]
MILLPFLLGLALGAPSESPSDDNEVKLQLDDRAVKLQHGNCPTYWWSFNGRCYKYVATPKSWSDAEFYCLSQGAHLVSIHNMEEDNFVRSLIRNSDPDERATWIGLSDIHREGRWMWSDGSVVDFFNWKKGEPNNRGNEDCVTRNYRTIKQWNDWPCSSSCASVCLKHKVCA